jgi:carbon monoxide dehydrogenase subunit G
LKVEDAFEIDAPRWTVWKVLVDPSYIPKLFPEIITAEMDPPGEIKLGSRSKVYGKIGKIRFEIYLEFPRVDTEACLISRQLPGGLFRAFSQVVVIEALDLRTRVRTSFEFALVPEYAAQVTDVALFEQTVTNNLHAYARNLKEICELLPLPT